MRKTIVSARIDFRLKTRLGDLHRVGLSRRCQLEGILRKFVSGCSAWVCLFLAGTGIGQAADEWRTWKSTAGTAIEAKLLSSDGKDVTLEKRDGKKLSLPLVKLSEATARGGIWIGGDGANGWIELLLRHIRDRFAKQANRSVRTTRIE